MPPDFKFVEAHVTSFAMLAHLAMLATVSGWASTTGAACTVDPAVCGTYCTKDCSCHGSIPSRPCRPVPPPPPPPPALPVPSGIAWAGNLGANDLATVMNFWNALEPHGFKGMALTLPLNNSTLWKDIKTKCQCTLYYVSANSHGSIPLMKHINAVIGPDMADGIVFDQSKSQNTAPNSSFCAGMPAMLKTNGFGTNTEILYAIDHWTCERDIRAAMLPGGTLAGYHIVFIGDGYSTGNAYSALCPHGKPDGLNNGKPDGRYTNHSCPQPDKCSVQTTPRQSAGCKCASIVQANLNFTHTNYVDAEYIMEACPSQTAWYYFEAGANQNFITPAEVTFQIERAVMTLNWTGFGATLKRPPYIWPNIAPAGEYQAEAGLGSSPAVADRTELR